jgi:hypothetical protein
LSRDLHIELYRTVTFVVSYGENTDFLNLKEEQSFKKITEQMTSIFGLNTKKETKGEKNYAMRSFTIRRSNFHLTLSG